MILVFGATGHIGGARILSAVIGRPITYQALSLEEARERMARAGDAPWSIEGLLARATYQRAGGPTAVVHDTVQQILGRPPRSLGEFAKDHTQTFRGD